MPPSSVAESYWLLYQQPQKRLDVRAGNSPVRREVVAGASRDGTESFQRGRCVSRRGARLHRGELSAGNARSQSRDRSDQGADAALASHPPQEGVDRAAVAERIWRPGLVDHATLHLRTGDVARRDAAAAGVQRHHGRPGHLHLRQRRAEEEVSAANSLRRGLVVPGLFGTGLRLRPRLGPHQGGARRRSLHRQRPQDLDDAGPACRLDFLPGAHRPCGKAAGRHLLPADRHEIARRHRAAHHHHRRLARGQRRLPRRRARPGRKPDRRGKQGLDLREIPARQRAHQHGRHRPLDALPERASSRS